MKNKWVLLIFALLLAVLVFCLWDWYRGDRYEIDPQVSNWTENAMPGVKVRIEATRKTCSLTVENGADHYIVVDIPEKPMKIEVLQPDGWHRLQAYTGRPNILEAVPEGAALKETFSWRELLGARLKPGTYRAVFYHGDGKLNIWDWYSIAVEFTVK